MQEENDGLPQPQRLWAVLALAVSIAMAVMDSSIANVALPAIGRDLGTGLSGLQWVLDGYLLTLSSLLLLGGSLGDLYGRRLVVELWERLRDERAFASEAELVEQIGRDVERTRAAAPPV